MVVEAITLSGLLGRGERQRAFGFASRESNFPLWRHFDLPTRPVPLSF